jgi:hypothetical protein
MAQKYDVVLAPGGAPDVVTHQRFAAETDAFAGLVTALPPSVFRPFCLLGFPSAAKRLSEATERLFYRSLG